MIGLLLGGLAVRRMVRRAKARPAPTSKQPVLVAAKPAPPGPRAERRAWVKAERAGLTPAQQRARSRARFAAIREAQREGVPFSELAYAVPVTSKPKPGEPNWRRTNRVEVNDDAV